MRAHIARQPIFDRGKKAVAYELLYRDGTGNAAHIQDGDAASRSVLSDAITVFGLPQLTDRLPAYIHFTRNLLLGDFAYLADPKEIVLEVMNDIEIDETLTLKIAELRRAGYRFALKNYDGRIGFDRLLRYFSVFSLDVSADDRLRRQDLVKKLDRAGVLLLAEKVETFTAFKAARDMGFSLFKGWFFEEPTCLSARAPSALQSACGRLLCEMLRPNVNFDACSELIAGDMVLLYLFMRRQGAVKDYRSGAAPKEIRRGLIMMGTNELRRWAGLAMLRESNVTHTDELPRRAYLRGLFLERLAENADAASEPRQAFWLGVLSLLDGVTGLRMESLLAELRPGDALKAALLGAEENEYSALLQFAVIYEMGNPNLILPDIRLRLTDAETAALYMECIADTDAAFVRLGGRI